MKLRLMIAPLVLAFTGGSVNAEQLSFYEKETDTYWTVYGGAETETGQATCWGREQEGWVVR